MIQHHPASRISSGKIVSGQQKAAVDRDDAAGHVA
jgi:hypothetical protein